MSNRVKSLFNMPVERHALMRSLRHAVPGRGAVALVSGLYAVWLSACCAGPAVLLGAPDASGALFRLPSWMGPILAMAVASAVIAIRFKRCRREREGSSWLGFLAGLMTVALAVHLAWAMGLGPTLAVSWLLYGTASVLSGAGAALFRVEIDRVFGWIGTQQTLLQGMLGTLVTVLTLAACVGIGNVDGGGVLLPRFGALEPRRLPRQEHGPAGALGGQLPGRGVVLRHDGRRRDKLCGPRGALPRGYAVLGSFVARFLFAMALYLSSGDNLKYGWGTVLPGESGFEADDLGGVVRFMATERGVTQRETEVMALLVAGKSRREICDELTVSPDTVKTHARSVYRKMGVHSQQELIDRVIAERERLMLDGGAETVSEDRLK